MSTMEASPRPVPPIISSEVDAFSGRNGSTGDKSGAIEIPLVTTVAEENIDGGVVAFPRKLLRLLLVSDGVAVFAPIALFLMSSIAETAEDYNRPNPVIALLSLLSCVMSILLSVLSILAPVLAYAMHSKTSKEEHKQSTKQILRIHVATVITDIVATSSYARLFLMLSAMASTMIPFVLVVLALIALRIACFLLVIKLHKKIKTSDNEAVKYAVAQSLIEKKGVEIV